MPTRPFPMPMFLLRFVASAVFLIYVAVAGASLAAVGIEASGARRLLWQLTREAGPVETGTWLALLALAGICLLAWKALEDDTGLSARGRRWLRLGLIGLALLSVAGVLEETSFGQHLFGFAPPEFFEQHSTQHELNMHNLIPAELFNTAIYAVIYLALVYPPLLARALPGLADRIIPKCWRTVQPDLDSCLMLVWAATLQAWGHPRALPDSLALIGAVILAGLGAWRGRDAGDGLARPERLAHLAMILFSAGFLILHRQVLDILNIQYEIRELVCVLAMAHWTARLPGALLGRTGPAPDIAP